MVCSPMKVHTAARSAVRKPTRKEERSFEVRRNSTSVCTECSNAARGRSRIVPINHNNIIYASCL